MTAQLFNTEAASKHTAAEDCERHASAFADPLCNPKSHTNPAYQKSKGKNELHVFHRQKESTKSSHWMHNQDGKSH